MLNYKLFEAQLHFINKISERPRFLIAGAFRFGAETQSRSHVFRCHTEHY